MRPLFQDVFRTDFASPGFALWNLGAISSAELRRRMVELKLDLADQYRERFGRHLGYLSVARFNQQVTTKFHLDGAPDESYLMLGYEPTVVRSEIAFADYTHAAFEVGVTPREYLERFNPMYAVHADRLAPYISRLDAFDPSSAQILLINNSAQAYVPGRMASLGVMHQATIPIVMPDESRVVNSAMLGVFDSPDQEPIGRDEVERFAGAMPVAGSY